MPATLNISIDNMQSKTKLGMVYPLRAVIKYALAQKIIALVLTKKVKMVNTTGPIFNP